MPSLATTLVLSTLMSRLYLWLTRSRRSTNSCSSVSDQFGFQPTGSTTAALITLLHTISHMLSSNAYVRVLSPDYSKALDMVRHAPLFNKLLTLNMPDEVYNWMRD